MKSKQLGKPNYTVIVDGIVGMSTKFLPSIFSYQKCSNDKEPILALIIVFFLALLSV